MIGVIDVQAKHNCYALRWSFGEICVGCGCCDKDPLKRAKARLDYYTDLLEESENFSHWFEDDPELLALQKKNKASDIRYAKRRIAYYKKRIETLERSSRR